MRRPTECSVERIPIKLPRASASPGRAEIKIHQIIKLNKTINIWLKILQILKSLQIDESSSSSSDQTVKKQSIKPKLNSYDLKIIEILLPGADPRMAHANRNGNFKLRSTQSVKTFASRKQHSHLPFQSDDIWISPDSRMLDEKWVSEKLKRKCAIAMQPLQSLHALPFVLAFLVCIKWISYWHTL